MPLTLKEVQRLFRVPPDHPVRLRDYDPAWAGAMLLALEDGFRLHRLIDPESTPADSFLRAVGELQKLTRA